MLQVLDGDGEVFLMAVEYTISDEKNAALRLQAAAELAVSVFSGGCESFGGVRVCLVGGHRTAFFSGDAYDIDSIDAADVFTMRDIERFLCWQEMKEPRLLPIVFNDGKPRFGLVLHPYQMYTLRSDNNYGYYTGASSSEVRVFTSKNIPHAPQPGGTQYNNQEKRGAVFFGQGKDGSIHTIRWWSWADCPI